MIWGERLKGLGIAFALLFICVPLAIVITIFTSPLWRWIEASFNIESFGHSGPAEWCYLLVYLCLIIIGTIFWTFLKKNKQS